MTKPRTWPNSAENARLESIARMMRILGELRAIARDEKMSAASLQRVVNALDLAQEVRIELMMAGARPGQPADAD